MIICFMKRPLRCSLKNKKLTPLRYTFFLKPEFVDLDMFGIKISKWS